MFCKNLEAWAGVSAREGTNITAAMQLLIEQIVQNAKILSSLPSSGSQTYSASLSSKDQSYDNNTYQKNSDQISESKNQTKHKSTNSQIQVNYNTSLDNQNKTIKLTKENYNSQKRTRTSQHQTECAC
jgi:hypothetical protein